MEEESPILSLENSKKNKNRFWFVVKTLIVALLLIIYFWFMGSIEPLINNHIALSQMQINDESFWVYQTYTQFKSYVPYVLGIICLLVYSTNIARLIKYIRRKISNETN